MIPFSFKRSSFSFRVVEPFTSKPFSTKKAPKGRPSQPQPMIEMLGFLFILVFITAYVGHGTIAFFSIQIKQK
jgi:hypothetical protein